MRVLRTALLGMAPLLVPSVVVAQTSLVTGRITDARGEGIIGANIMVEGTTTGASADLDGNYRFSIAPGRYRIVVTAVGYARATRSVTLAAGQTLTENFQLPDDVINADEVVVTGAGTATLRRELGIDVESVGGDLVQGQNTPSVSTALIGKIPGVQITESAVPGAENLIILRGINSFASGGRPLLLIDGVQSPSDMLSSLDPNTIDRIEVVKGAAAATLYGAQGANGVIQVFLKRGQPGAPRVQVSSSVAASQISMGNFELADVHSFATDASGNISGLSIDPATGFYTNVAQIVSPGSVINKPYTIPIYDNLSGLYQTGVLNTNTVSVSGGSDRLTYFGSYGFTTQRGIETETGQNKHQGRLSLGVPITRQANVNLSFTVNNDTYRNLTASGNSVLSTLGSSLATPRYINLQQRDTLGLGYDYRLQQYQQQTNNNPFFDKEYRDAQTDRLRMIGSAQFNYRPFRFLELDYTLGAIQTNTRANSYQYNVQNVLAALGVDTSPILTPQGQAASNSNNLFDFTSTAGATLRSDLQRDFGLGFPVRSTTQVKFDYRSLSQRFITTSGTGLPPFRNLVTVRALAERVSDQFDLRFITYGGLINQKFDFGEVAGFEVGGRADQSSAFAAGEGVEFFPRANAYFRLVPLLGESMRQNLTEAKLRVAYGSAGTQPGAYDRIITLSQGLIGNTSYFINPDELSNPDLTVERSNEFEAGLDLNYSVSPTFLSAIGLNATYWTRTSENVINTLPLAPSVGSGSIYDNGYTFASNGFDLGLQTVWLTRRNFSWSTTFNFSKQNTIVDDVRGPLTELVLNDEDIPYLIREGEDVGSFYGFKAVRSLTETLPGTTTRLISDADAYKYGFVDGRVVNVETQRVLFRPYRELLGSPTPDFVLTMRNDFQLWRDVSLGIQLDWNQGGDLYNATRQRLYQYNLSAENTVPIEIVGSTPNPSTGQVLRPINPATGNAFEGPQAYAAYYSSLYNTSNANEYFVEDGSYLKLRELSVRVGLQRTLERMGLRRAPQAALSLSGRNLFTISSYTGFDPEVNQGGVSVAGRGYDYYTYPNYRTYTLGLNVTF